LTDEPLRIRHVRLCQCGKLAGHDSICKPGRAPAGLDPERDVERVDAETEELFARRREARFAKRKQAFDAERRQQIALTDVLGLHRSAIERQATISTVKAGSTERGRGGSEPSGPPQQQMLDDDPRWRESWTVIRSRLERVHELLDEAEGLSTVAATTTMLGVEKDRRVISDGEGLSPVAVVEKLGRDIAGSPETVRRIRKKFERSTVDGQPRLDISSSAL
jgi:hypothetical protein